MDNICEYKVIIKGRKNACYAFFGSMSVLDCKIIVEENGTDDDYTVLFHGDCNCSVDSCCTPWNGECPVALPDDANKAMRLAEDKYWYKTVRDRSRMFGVEVMCNSAETEDGVKEKKEKYEHYIRGEAADGECPDELRIIDLPPDGYCRCVVCGGEFPKEDCNEYGEDTYFCHSCFAYTFGM